MGKCNQVISCMLLTILIFGVTAEMVGAAPTFTESIKAKNGTTNKILLTFSEGVQRSNDSNLIASDFNVTGTSGLTISGLAHTIYSNKVILTMSSNINLNSTGGLTIGCQINSVLGYDSYIYCGTGTIDVFNATIDTISPQITTVNVVDSGDGNTSISPGDQVFIYFSETMNASTITLENVDTSLGLSGGHTFNASYFYWNKNRNIIQINLGSATTVVHGDTVNPIDTVTDALENADNSTDKSINDTAFPTFAIQYYSDAGFTVSLGNNPKLNVGTYYLIITASEALSGTPIISMDAEGTANDVIDNTTTLFSEYNFSYNRTIAYDFSAIGYVLENISITGTDAANNTATNADPTNEPEKAAYTDIVATTRLKKKILYYII